MANELRLHQNWIGGRLLHALPAAATVVTDGATTNADATVTSATAAFTAADVGAPISGTGIPAGAYILSLNSASSVEISANATATGSGVTLTIGRHQVMHSDALAAMQTVGTTAHMMVGLDPDGMAGSPEAVMVTKHDSAATWAQVTRAQETTAARAHAAGMDWITGLFLSDTPAAAKAWRSAAFTLTSGGTADILVADTEVYDAAGAYSTATGKYATPYKGIYAVKSRVQVSAPANGERFLIDAFVDGTAKVRGTDAQFVTGGNTLSLLLDGEVLADAGALIDVRITQVNGTGRALELAAERSAWVTFRKVA